MTPALDDVKVAEIEKDLRFVLLEQLCRHWDNTSEFRPLGKKHFDEEQKKKLEEIKPFTLLFNTIS